MMDTMARRMEISDDFGRAQPLQAPMLSSTSGEGEADTGIGAYNFTARRKNRRKTITLNDSQRPPLGGQSLSESAFGTPSPSPFHATLPPSQLRLQTSFNPLDYNHVLSPGQISPRRSIGRNAVTGSPVKKQAGVVLGALGAAAVHADVIGGDDLKEMERGRGRGIPRTLTLPAHLTESLMMMKITREREGSTDQMGVYTEAEGRGSVDKVDKDGMEVDGMEVDPIPPTGSPSRKPLLRVVVAKQGADSTIVPSQEEPPASPRKARRRRAKSLPPPPTMNANDDDECDADDEGGGLKHDEDEDLDAGLMSPVIPRRRGRQDAVPGVIGVTPAHGRMEAMKPGAVAIPPSGALRRSARRVKATMPPTGVGAAFGGPNPFLKGIAEAEAGSGMEGVDVVNKGNVPPRKRARTREGGDRERERGRDEEGRATKRTRKR